MRRGFQVIVLFIVVTFIYTMLLVQTNIASILKDLFESGDFFLSGKYWLYIFEIGLGLLAVLISFRIILKQTYAYNKSHWIIIMLLSPVIGIILYVVFARDFTTKKLLKTRPLIAEKQFLKLEEKTDPHLENYDKCEVYQFIKETTRRSVYENDTYVEVLNNGDIFFPRLISELQQAEDYIMMEFYIIKNDQIGTRVMDVLKEKARTGVDVYLIYDHLGSNKYLKHEYLQSLKASGVKVGVFDPQKISLFNSNVNFRNHRKAIIIDGHIGFVGGMNLADEYNHDSVKFGFWRDTHVLIRGNGVTSIQNVFIKDWYYITANVLEKPLDKSIELFPGLFSVIESGPDFEIDMIKDVYLKMIVTAKKSIKIVTPYLIIEPEMMSALKIAARSNVEVTFLVPGKSDYVTVGFATRSFYEQLLSYGIKIFELKDHFVHSKILIVDDVIASVGSVNFDPRSFHLNFEVTCIFSNPAVDVLVKSFADDLTKSNEINAEVWKKRGFFRRFIQGLFNLFSPLF
ncbi:MAG: cardiolipin synthase [Candidatus Izemoplasmatales bacterium]|jgi:cardiolipin synthase